MKIRINPNPEVVAAVRAAIAANDGYCPCAVVKTPDTKCMCRDFLEQPEGPCHCGLYEKVDEEALFAENEELRRKLRVARLERDQAREKLARFIGRTPE